MKVGIVGLGLIGGSFAKVYKKENHTVYAFDTDTQMLDFARIEGSVDDVLTNENISECRLVLVCLYPEAAIKFFDKMGPYIGDVPIVIDCCGTKREVVKAGFKASEKYGFTYVGGHPMAGTQYSGFKYSRANLFNNATMVLVPKDRDDISLMSRIKVMLSPARFKNISISTAEEHDEVIAFTSQLAHLVSNAYIKSPRATGHKGLSAGSYKDMTRVAWLNPEMWAELFLENKDNLIEEVDTLIKNLDQYKQAIEQDDKEKLIKLLKEGKTKKEEVDGRGGR